MPKPRGYLRASLMTDDETFAKYGDEIVKAERRPPGPGDRFPSSRAGLIVTEEDRAFVSQIVMETVEAASMKPVTNDEELEQRIADYYSRCSFRGIVPTVEEMCLYSGYTQGWWTDVLCGRNKGFSHRTSVILKKAREHMASIDAKLVDSGKLNFLTYCFRAKNFYGMTDKTEVTIAPKTQDYEAIDPDEIRKKYLSACNPIQTDFVD